MTKDEEVINQIYQKQLDAILFSVNQYSDDVTSSWISKIESQQDVLDSLGFEEILHSTSISFIFFVDSAGGEAPKIIADMPLGNSDLSANIDALIREHTAEIDRLKRYKEVGFQKIEPLDARLPNFENLAILLFILDKPLHGKSVCGVVINPEDFIINMLRPKIQTVAEDRFLITAFKKENNRIIYTTIDTLANVQKTARAVTNDFWIFPEYYLGISLKGKSIDKIVKERTDFNLFLILTLDLVLILAVWIVFRYVKKEIRLAETKSDFISNVSHEIRTPLSLISMFAETLELGRVTSEEKRNEYYRIISRETGRLSGIVNKILNFSRLEAKKADLHFNKMDLNVAVREVIETYHYHLESNDFDCRFHPEDNLFIEADKEAMIEVIGNLIDNAVKYSGESKRIDITTGTSGSYAFLSVQDYGNGISKKDQKYIFDKFYRVPSGDIAKSKGTGLGLSLVKQIVDKHKGKIDVKSELKKGALFTVYLPLKQ
ncbi:sensor histidine kinase [Fulvivirga ligni]|uniref:sensor histidine kinase n=1 Tax=Fulvivirga ligni TaxID=2904246 RepID=UPI001F43ED2B|nr:HAMP domain-containing sensor histidine kinase [Fulvivirga ligni]UII22087.1 HAMP domain-containing histidine kinase [Fulvivirga ligni]